MTAGVSLAVTAWTIALYKLARTLRGRSADYAYSIHLSRAGRALRTIRGAEAMPPESLTEEQRHQLACVYERANTVNELAEEMLLGDGGEVDAEEALAEAIVDELARLNHDVLIAYAEYRVPPADLIVIRDVVLLEHYCHEFGDFSDDEERAGKKAVNHHHKSGRKAA